MTTTHKNSTKFKNALYEYIQIPKFLNNYCCQKPNYHVDEQNSGAQSIRFQY